MMIEDDDYWGWWCLRMMMIEKDDDDWGGWWCLRRMMINDDDAWGWWWLMMVIIEKDDDDWGWWCLRMMMIDDGDAWGWWLLRMMMIEKDDAWGGWWLMMVMLEDDDYWGWWWLRRMVMIEKDDAWGWSKQTSLQKSSLFCTRQLFRVHILRECVIHILPDFNTGHFNMCSGSPTDALNFHEYNYRLVLTFSRRAITSSWFRQYGAYTFLISSATSRKHGPAKGK